MDELLNILYDKLYIPTSVVELQQDATECQKTHRNVGQTKASSSTEA